MCRNKQGRGCIRSINGSRWMDLCWWNGFFWDAPKHWKSRLNPRLTVGTCLHTFLLEFWEKRQNSECKLRILRKKCTPRKKKNCVPVFFQLPRGALVGRRTEVGITPGGASQWAKPFALCVSVCVRAGGVECWSLHSQSSPVWCLVDSRVCTLSLRVILQNKRGNGNLRDMDYMYYINRLFQFASSFLNFAQPNIRRLHGNRVADHGAKRTPSAVGATRPEVIRRRTSLFHSLGFLESTVLIFVFCLFHMYFVQ